MRSKFGDKITKSLYDNAQYNSVTWPLCPPEGIAFVEHKLSFVNLLILGSGGLPFPHLEVPIPLRIFASPEPANIIVCLPYYESLGDRQGTLNGIWEVTRILDPEIIPDREFLIVRGDHAARGLITGEFTY